jgi:fructose-bisphosphate aldolase, class I
VVSGGESAEQAGIDEVADATLACLREVVPAAVPGIVFLSGGQSDEAATAHLNAINQRGPQPWQLSFSYGRALQAPVLEAWKGEAGNGPAAQQAFLHRATLNGAARSGDYRTEMEHRAWPMSPRRARVASTGPGWPSGVTGELEPTPILNGGRSRRR